MLLALFDLSLAASPGLYLPGANVQQAGHGDVIAGAFFYSLDSEAYSGLNVRASGAITDKIAVDASFFYSGDIGGGVDPGGMLPLIAGRYLVHQGDYVNFAIIAGNASAIWNNGTERVVDNYTAAGFALEGGGDRVRWDVSLPFIGFEHYAPPDMIPYNAVLLLPVTIQAAETGVTFRFAETSAVRLGQASLLPNATYRYSGRIVLWEVGLTGSPFQPNMFAMQTRIGARF